MQHAGALGRSWPITRTVAKAIRLTFNKRYFKIFQ
jgi:hypothetical protein